MNPKTGFPDIWLTDLTRGNTAPFTFGPATNAAALWSPEGSKILFRSTRTGGLTELYAKSTGGGGKDEPVLLQAAMHGFPGVLSALTIPTDWSPDGADVLLSVNVSSESDLWVLPLGSEPKPTPLFTAPGDQWHGNFSPDGRLVAYTSNESGRFDVYVQTFPPSDRRWTVSTGGGYEPRWRGDGREIYYLSGDGKLMAVPVAPGPSFGVPTQLFQTAVAQNVTPQRTHYVASRDGQRFLIAAPAAEQRPIVTITVVLNATSAFTP